MPKNIVICCDGTDNKLTIDKNTNVLHLYSFLEKSNQQATYYNPGVGTIAPDGLKNNFFRFLSRAWDLATAYSLENNVMDAYRYLMNTYEDGDHVYLFGFSRGAYTVRMLSGVLEMFGLLEKGNENHLRHILKVYSQKDDKFQLGHAFRNHISKEIKIHFIGVWDTVVSIGNPFSFYVSYPYSSQLGIATTVRHAASIDERRKHYRLTHLQNQKNADHKEVYFAGVHSDVGGSYAEKEGGLARISLRWMLGESMSYGLKINLNKVTDYLDNYPEADDLHQKPHNSLSLFFMLFDFVPRIRYHKDGMFGMKIDFRLWPIRQIKSTALVHDSVFKKMELQHPGHVYNPKNIQQGNNAYVRVYSKDIYS